MYFFFLIKKTKHSLNPEGVSEGV